MAQGGIVEEMLQGEPFASPSVQVDLLPDGAVKVLATALVQSDLPAGGVIAVRTGGFGTACATNPRIAQPVSAGSSRNRNILDL